MRGLVGFVVSACVASFVATTWIVMLGDGESLIASFRLPDVVAARVPELAISFRRLLEFYREAPRAAAVLVDLPAGFLIFLIINLPGALLLWGAEHAFGQGRRWNTFKPLWSGLGYGLMATTLVLVAFEYGLPLLADLRLSPIGAAFAALFAGAVLGLAPTPLAEPVETTSVPGRYT